MPKIKLTKDQREVCLKIIREEREEAQKAISEYRKVTRRLAILETILASARPALAQHDDVLSKYVVDAIDKYS